MKTPFIVALKVVFTVSGGLALAVDPANGRKPARQCSICRGELRLATDPEVPNPAGQSGLCIEKCLVAFQKRLREDRRMTLIAEPLSLPAPPSCSVRCLAQGDGRRAGMSLRACSALVTQGSDRSRGAA